MSIVTNLIEMQYQNSMQCVKDLENCAGAVKSVSLSDVNEIFENINAAWKGEPASNCLGKIMNLQGDILQDAQIIEKTADVVKTIADNVRSAELEAYRIATGRSCN